MTGDEMTGRNEIVGQSVQIPYEVAAVLLGVQRTSVKQLVQRGHLHSVPAPEDRRRRKLLLSEVQAYAESHAGKWSYGQQLPALATPPAASPLQTISPQTALAGAASVGTAALLIAALKSESDATFKLLLIGALVGLALLLILELRRNGKLDAAQAHRMEKLAKSAEATPDVFIAELEPLLALAS
jgi:hypothetical protein